MLRAMLLDMVEQSSRHMLENVTSFLDQLHNLLDLDHTGHLSTDKWLLLQLIDTPRRNMQAARFACSHLGSRMDLSRMALNVPHDALRILQGAVELGAWNLASKVVGQVDFATPGAATIAIIQAMVVGDEGRDDGRWDLIIRAVNAGVDVHWCPPRGSIKNLCLETYIFDRDPDTMSLLSWTVQKKWAPLIELMVQRWPIRGDTRAIQAQYLHQFLGRLVLFRDFDEDYENCSEGDPKETDFRICNKIIRLLVAAGADHTAIDLGGKVPLSILLSGLETRPDCIKEYACWLKPLCQGVQVDTDLR